MGCRGGAWPLLCLAVVLLLPLGDGLAGNAAAPLNAPLATESVTLAEALRRRLDTGAERLRLDGVVVAAEPVRAFYRARQFQPLWVDPSGLTERAHQTLRLLAEVAAEHGLPAAAGGKGDPPAASPAGAVDRFIDRELSTNAALLSLARSLRSGRIDPRVVDGEYALTPPTFDVTATLMSAGDLGQLRAHLARLAPRDPTYVSLREALVVARRVAAAHPTWPRLPDGPALKPGESREVVPLVRRMLSSWGDYDGMPSASPHYDPALVRAVRAFQRRHGLEPDGVIGSRTRAALNVSPADRVAQVAVNMERWRWMPRELGEPHILVNMAGFDLKLVMGGVPQLTMRVVVGQPFRRTPVFGGEITYLEFNPTWTVPKTIAVEDLLPKIRRNPRILEAQGIRVLARGADGTYAVDPSAVNWHAVGSDHFPYKLRQAPGPQNPLGRVKFMFPNAFAVYLHDTPKRELFARAERAFSSGCIRVEQPLELAEALLATTPGWDRQRIEAVIERGVTRQVTLARPVAIHLVYLTAWLDGEGQLQFREDLYGRDSRLLQFIFKNDA